MPTQLDIKGRYKAVREPLGLAPGREDVSPQIAADVREILGGLNSTSKGSAPFAPMLATRMVVNVVSNG